MNCVALAGSDNGGGAVGAGCADEVGTIVTPTALTVGLGGGDVIREDGRGDGMAVESADAVVSGAGLCVGGDIGGMGSDTPEPGLDRGEAEGVAKFGNGLVVTKPALLLPAVAAAAGATVYGLTAIAAALVPGTLEQATRIEDVPPTMAPSKKQ